MRKAFEFYDMHIPHQIPLKGVESYANDFVEEHGPTDRVYGGDQLDFSCISHWNLDKLRQLEGKRLKSDYDHANRILDRHDKIFKSKQVYWLTGNHEDWLDQLYDRFPALEGLLDIESNLRLKERGYKIIPLNSYAKIGKLFYIHGISTSTNHARTTLQQVGRSVVYGHIHNVQVHTAVSPIDSNEIHRATSLPCMCDMKPPYLKNRPTNWSNGFGIAFIRPDGCFQHHIIDIIKGKFIGLNGKEYKA
jgi:hypothetical protein